MKTSLFLALFLVLFTSSDSFRSSARPHLTIDRSSAIAEAIPLSRSSSSETSRLTEILFEEVNRTLLFPAFLTGGIHWSGKEKGGFEAVVEIPETKIGIQDYVTVALSLQFPSTHKPDLDTVRMNLLRYAGVFQPPFALVEEKIEETGPGSLKASFTLEPQLANLHFLSLYNIPFLPLNKEEGKPAEIISDIFQIEVALPETDPAYAGHPYGMLPLTEKLPIEMTQHNKESLLSSEKIRKESKRSEEIVKKRSIPFAKLLGILLFIIAAFIARMRLTRPLDMNKELQKTQLSAREKALKALQALNHAKPEQLYAALADTLRKYIEERYQLPASAQTTQEFLYAMAKRSVFDKETQAMLAHFMANADKVKFAGETPSGKACEQAKQIALRFIQSEESNHTF